MVLPNPGDILNFRQIDRETYDSIREEIEDGTYRYNYDRVEFEPQAFFEDPGGYNEQLLEVLD